MTDDFFEEIRLRIERYLDQLLPAESEPPARLHAAMRWAVLGGGKRLRPGLACGAALACGGKPECALPAAAAVELVHAYSLVHDDLPAMDDDRERRGRPTVWVQFGEALAILAGDALLAQAFAALAAAGAPIELVERLARAAGSCALVGGQADDLEFAAAGATLEALEAIHARKTAALFGCAAWGGARLAGASGARLRALERYGTEYGMAFQLADDLEDERGAGCSALQLLAPEAVRERALGHLERATRELCDLPGPTGPLRALAEQLTRRLV